MKIIKAPDIYDKQEHEVACFLAGGCTNNNWRQRFYTEMNNHVVNSLVVYDPYNPNYDSKNPFSQIQWEFNYLNNYIGDKYIFSAYFDKHTTQAMTMYELGRMLAFCNGQFATLCYGENNSIYFKTAQVVTLQKKFKVVLSMCDEAPLKEDLKCQCGLLHHIIEVRTPEEHAQEVFDAYLDLY